MVGYLVPNSCAAFFGGRSACGPMGNMSPRVDGGGWGREVRWAEPSLDSSARAKLAHGGGAQIRESDCDSNATEGTDGLGCVRLSRAGAHGAGRRLRGGLRAQREGRSGQARRGWRVRTGRVGAEPRGEARGGCAGGADGGRSGPRRPDACRDDGEQRARWTGGAFGAGSFGLFFESNGRRAARGGEASVCGGATT
jgi:hypothetical protein